MSPDQPRLTEPSVGRTSPDGAAHDAPALVVEHLTHRFKEVTALDEVSFHVPSGSIFGLLGPNGSGKTTLFSILSTLRRPQQGTVSVLGHDVRTSPHEVRRALGVSFQDPSIDPQLTCLENLKHQGHLYGIAGSTLRQRANDLLARFGLAERSRHRAGTLSGGQQRRLELAKALLHQPHVLLLDEPATGLDVVARQMLWEDLESLRSEYGVTILLTTHLMKEAERCDRLAILNAGKVAAAGAPGELKRGIGNEVLRIETDEPDALLLELNRTHGLEGVAINGSVRIEHPSAHRLVPDIIESLSGRVRGVQISPPSLEDVFLHATGLSFKEAESASREEQT